MEELDLYFVHFPAKQVPLKQFLCFASMAHGLSSVTQSYTRFVNIKCW